MPTIYDQNIQLLDSSFRKYNSNELKLENKAII